MTEATRRGDSDRADIDRLQAAVSHLQSWVQNIASDLDALAQRVGAHILEPCASQNEVATLRILLRTITARVAALEEGKPKPPEGGKHAPS